MSNPEAGISESSLTQCTQNKTQYLKFFLNVSFVNAIGDKSSGFWTKVKLIADK